MSRMNEYKDNSGFSPAYVGRDRVARFTVNENAREIYPHAAHVLKAENPARSEICRNDPSGYIE